MQKCFEVIELEYLSNLIKLIVDNVSIV